MELLFSPRGIQFRLFRRIRFWRWLRLCAVTLAFAYSNTTFAELSGAISVMTPRVDLVQSGHYQRWVTRFTEQYPAANVNIVPMADYRDLLLKRLRSGDIADVMLVPRDLPRELLTRYFLPLNIDKEQLYFTQAWSVGGAVYALPRGLWAEGLLYNKSLLRDAGFPEPPRNVKSLYAACAKVAEQDKVGIYLNIGAGWPLRQFGKAMLLLSGDSAYPNSMAVANDPFGPDSPAREALAIAKNLYDSECTEQSILGDTWTASLGEFNTGVGMMLATSWMIPDLLKAGVQSDNLGFSPLPFGPEKNNGALVSAEWGLAIHKQSRHAQLARKWIEHLLENPDFFSTQGLIPNNKTTAITLTQLKEFMQSKPTLMEYQKPSEQFMRLSSIANMDYFSGNYVRDILLSSNFDQAVDYLNWRWQQARLVSARGGHRSER